MSDIGMTPAQDRDLLVGAARRSGAIAMRFFRASPQIWEKADDQGPVTEADIAINEMLLGSLRPARPGYGWLSEESEDDAARLAKERVFIVDPIDGTRAFIAGEPGFSVALAVAERGNITAAAVYLPARDQLFAAALGCGATCDGHPLRVVEPKSQPTVLTAAKQMQPDKWPGGVPDLKRSFRSSLAWRLCLVAESKFDCALSFRDTYQWDIAAGCLIASEAGVCVTDGLGRALRFNTAQVKGPGIIAAPPGLHAALMQKRLARVD